MGLVTDVPGVPGPAPLAPGPDRGAAVNAFDLVRLLSSLVLAAIFLGGLYAWIRQLRIRPSGEVLAADDLPSRRLDGDLVSETFGLRGRPDELRRLPGGEIVPVEIKSARAPRSPWPSHRAQLWAYCLLVEETWGRSPPFGILVYRDGREWILPWDRSARVHLENDLREMRRDAPAPIAPSVRKCRRCRWRAGCEGAQAVGVARQWTRLGVGKL